MNTFGKLGTLVRSLIPSTPGAARQAVNACRTRLGMEPLEARLMPATHYLILDFSPDQYGASMTGSFAQTYQVTRNSLGQVPSFLDTNGDRRVNQADVRLAAQTIANKVASLYRGLHQNNLTVRYGDVDQNTGWGQQWLNWGKSQPAAHVSVLYIGGFEQGNTALGRAPAAVPGYNVEGFGEVYSRGIATSFANAPITATQYVLQVAEVAAHEYGHMLGLHHSSGDPYDVMAGSPAFAPGAKRFSNQWLWANDGTRWIPQNAVQELQRSFYSDQSMVVPQQFNGSPMPVPGLTQDDHDHDHDCESDHVHLGERPLGPAFADSSTQPSTVVDRFFGESSAQPPRRLNRLAETLVPLLTSSKKSTSDLTAADSMGR